MSDFCRNCKKNTYFWETECDYVCKECGMCAQVGIIDDTLERRNFSEGPDHSRGSVSHTRAMKTLIGNNRGKFSHLQKYIDGSSQNTFERNLDNGDSIISKLCVVLHEKDGLESEAKTIFEDFMHNTKKAKEEIAKSEAGDKKRKRIVTYGNVNLKPLGLACIFIAIQNRGTGATLRETLATIGDVDSKAVVKFVKKIGKTNHKKKKTNAPADVLGSIIGGLELWNVSQRSHEILKVLSDKMEGKRPATLAATSVLLACREKKVDVNPENLAIWGFCAESTLYNTIKQITKKKITF